MKKKDFLHLDENSYYGKGTHKKCFVHPSNSKLCIKIAYNRGGQKDLLREINYLKVLQRRKKDYSILPQYYGEVKTNLGKGYVYELIRDYDNAQSLTLEDILTNQNLFNIMFETVKNMLLFLKTSLLKNEIITMGLFPENIIFQKTAPDMGLFPENIIFQKTAPDKYNIRLVNDMGSGVLIPLEYHFHYFAKAKVERRWQEFLNTLKNNYNSELTTKLIALL